MTQIANTDKTKKLTRQGVVDLNEGGINGKGPTCPHYLNPHMVSVERCREPRLVLDADLGAESIENINVYYCANCGVERYTE
jgi:hypothetical protein